MKKFLTYILASIILLYSTAAMPLAFAVYGDDADPDSETEEPTQNEIKLVIPKPPSLPGPNVSTQEEQRGIRTWLVEKVLPNWTIGMIGFVGTLAFLMLIISGIRYLTAYGNEETATSAKKTIIYSLAALMLALFAYTIVRIIVNFSFA